MNERINLKLYYHLLLTVFGTQISMQTMMYRLYPYIVHSLQNKWPYRVVCFISLIKAHIGIVNVLLIGFIYLI